MAGSVAGLAIGIADLLVVGRRYPRIRALPLVPQLLDHVVFGTVVAFVIGREQRMRPQLTERHEPPLT